MPTVKEVVPSARRRNDLEARRRKLGLSRVALGRILDVDPATVFRRERGPLVRLCEGFRMPADDGWPRTPRLGAGVRKPPRNETAGSGTRSCRGRYGDLSAAEEARDDSRRH